MSVAHLTHKPMRKTVERTTVARLNRDGSTRMVELVTYRTHCMCGRVFATGSELLTEARYLGHLPKPKDPREGQTSE